jgi:hypothetical protein
MGAGFKEFAEMFCGIAKRIRPRYADAIEAELARLSRQRRFQFARRTNRSL